jgi:tetratricopeptide (TPR) repeat protein
MSPEEEEKYELFERYCSQELSINEEKELKRLINEGASVEEELKVYQEINTHLGTNFSTEKKQLESNIQEIGNTYFKNEKAQKVAHQGGEAKVIRIPVWGYAAAASIAIIVMVYFFIPQHPTYSDYASIPTLTLTERGIEDELIKETEELFNAKKYAEAEQSISKLIARDSANAEYQFYYGIVYLEQGKHDETTQIFKKLQQGNSVYKYRALWFEALNQLKQKHYDQCSELLKALPEDAEDYEQAQKLLRKLKK